MPPVEPLTTREIEVLVLLAQGLRNQEIADRLCVSRATVKTHIEHILGKLKASCRTEAAVWAVHAGLIPPEPLLDAS